MKINAKKKFISAVAVLALSATAIGGAISFSACGDKYISDGSNSAVNVIGDKTKISTARGVVYSNNSGNVYYISPTPAAEPAVNDINKPYDLSILGYEANASIVKPGDTVYVLPGVYHSASRVEILFSGAYNKYINIINAAYDKEHSGYSGSETEAVFDFSAQPFESTQRGIQIYGNYIYWYGIDICGAGDNGMYIGGSYNTIEYSEFYNNRDTGLQLGRSYSNTTDPKYNYIDNWPSYNLIKNCTSHNNYDNETYGENADGFAAKLTVGYGNVFDGCIAYRNSDDGWDLYAKTDSGNIGTVIIYNCVAYENGFLEYTQRECNKLYSTWNGTKTEVTNSDGTKNTDGENFYGKNSYYTRDGDGNGFKLGGSVMEGDVILNNCLSFNNRMHGVTDNSNPGDISLTNVTSYNNGTSVDDKTGIINKVSGTSHNNIDLARQSYSYNNLTKVLSVMDKYATNASSAKDAYRGSVSYSVLCRQIVKGSKDAKSDGSAYDAPDSATVFEMLPYTNDVHNINGVKDLGTYTFTKNETTGKYDSSLELNANRTHFKYRNEDGSVNMGNLLKIKADYNPIEGQKIGAYLSETSWDAYPHHYENDLVNGEAENEDIAKVERAKEALNINVDPDLVYQDFEVPSKMIDCTITWEADDEKVLVIGTDKKVSISQSEYITIYVYRDATEIKKVKLTATITCNEAETTKEFELKVRPGDPSIGTIFVTTDKGTVIKNGGSYVIDRYTIFNEPEIAVENGLDYNGKLLTNEQYKVDTTYHYQADSTAEKIQVSGYSPSTAGVYTVTHKVTLLTGKNANSTKSMSYKIFTASTTANVKFVEDKSSVSVNANGYVIGGTLSNSTGYLYAVSSVEELNVTTENIKELGEAIPFRSENISLQYKNSNSAAYNIYYALGNANGDITSKIYSKKIGVVEVSSEDAFKKLAGGEKLGSESVASTIYMLTKDLTFKDSSYSVGSNSFSGLLNGQGHTISNITASGTSVIYKLSGGTIMNLKFDKVNISSSSTKVGIIGEMSGGYVHNVQILNSKFKGANIVGALIGKASESANSLNISNVYVDSKTTVDGGTQRTGGIIGHIQSNASPVNSFICYISNCHVSANIKADKIVGGIVGEYDPNKITTLNENGNIYAYLEITSCVFDGEAYAPSISLGGMVGNHKGTSYLTITNCISIGKLYYNADGAKAELLTCQKNASGILGASTYSSTGVVSVSNCIALFTEYADSEFDVLVPDLLTIAGLYERRLSSDSWDIKYKEDDNTMVVAPYMSLKFLG